MALVSKSESHNHGGYHDDDYLAEISQYKGKSWYDMLLTNPWLAGNQAPYSRNVWEDIKYSVLGDNSAADSYYAQLKSNRSQWLSEFIEKMRQQEYNEPINQNERMRAAGVNSDLDPSMLDSNQASENDQPMLGHPSFGEPISVQDVGSFFMNLYSLASGFASDAVSLSSMMNKLTSEDLSINKDVVDSAVEYVKGHSALGTVTLDDGSYSYHAIPPTDDMISDYARKNFRSRRARRRFINEVKSSVHSGRSHEAVYSSLLGGQSSKSDLAKIIGRNEAYGDNELDPMIIVEKNLASLTRDVTKYQDTYTSDYFHHLSGKDAAAASNASNVGVQEEQKALHYKRGIDKIINRTFENIVSDLEKACVGNSLDALIAKGMLGYISAFRLQMIPSLPSVSISSKTIDYSKK